ncbi:hypothetical protein SAMN04488134_11329 [Amphibacillus marinus]|uniref:Short-chain dehydrogenase n=1 Tax=Amphibacillus marinus TaxID=872970 RepID=A0A1H8SM85_9BACI|nr:SDR family NAD(P)-dependent oxidoreductase [Amphibacillus marinus]SEO79474.1 hypothetical protein SAMN04488134_11329 [Amphibacillus marinus]
MENIANIAIVTGASSGIGRELVKLIDQEYASLDEIWVVARREERLTELQNEVLVKLVPCGLDLMRVSSYDELREKLDEHKPNVKLLANAAGYGKFGKIGQLSLDDELGMVRLNCEALTAVTSIVLPYIQPGGRIIQIASSAGFAPQPNFGIYAATKAYVISYSRALNEELRDRHIIVTAACPGPVETEFFDVAGESDRSSMIAGLPRTTPEQEARHVLAASRNGKAISTKGPVASGFRFLAKALPVGALLLAMRYLNKMK